MSENKETVYTFEEDKKAKRSDKTVKVLSVIIVIALIIISIIIGIIIGSRNGLQQGTQIISEEFPTETGTTEPETLISELYRIGDYVVTGADELRMRDDHSTNGNFLIAIPRGARITVSDIYYDPSSSLELQYWGLTSYLGHSGWIALYYTENAYSQAVVGTVPESTDAAAPVVSGEVTTAATQQTITRFEPGNYIVNTDSSLRIRQNHSVDSEMVETIPTGTKITITEVWEDPTAQASLRYWGKVTYNFSTGWIAMFYLVNAPEETTAGMTAETAPVQ